MTEYNRQSSPVQSSPVQSSPVQSSPVQSSPVQSTYVKNSSRKILLVTLYGNVNYGNILQRCALSRVIDSLGFEIRHLCDCNLLVQKPSIKKRTKTFVKQTIKRILALLGVQKYRKQILTQRELEPLFTKFQEQYIPITSRIYKTFQQAIGTNPSEWAGYDYAITGSDQVWRIWGHTSDEADYYYLSFMPREKRVCYAPSFGFTEIPESDYEFHKKGLAGFERVSCREKEMIHMIKRISGKDAELVLDPTLLLRPEDWRKFETKPDYDVPEKFVLCYFLGRTPAEYRAAIRKAAGNLPVISLVDPYEKAHLRTDPGAFLWLFDHADFVCTDSFHGTAFSVNFGKNFLAFRRKEIGMEDMFGRIGGLLDSLNISGHVYAPGMTIRPAPVNYDEAYSKLAALREISMNYLSECLK